LLEDLSRRDFTINGMAVDPASGEVVDPFGGRKDLAAGLVRAIGDPAARFGEDGLRPLRAVRFASRFGFAVEPATLQAIPAAMDRFRQVSAERVREEWSKILLSAKPSYGISLLEQTGLLAEFLPELAACRGVGQGGPHRFDVLDHQAYACDAAPAQLPLRLAAVLHDLGKPARRVEGSDGEPELLRPRPGIGQARRTGAAAAQVSQFADSRGDPSGEAPHVRLFTGMDRRSGTAIREPVGMDMIGPLAALRLADTSGMSNLSADPRRVMPCWTGWQSSRPRIRPLA
jgi:tRNA nucleotidyltransferase (CCA-adding enzyme)